MFSKDRRKILSGITRQLCKLNAATRRYSGGVSKRAILFTHPVDKNNASFCLRHVSGHLTIAIEKNIQLFKCQMLH